MTQAKAQTVASAIIGAGFQASAYQKPDGSWAVRAKSNDLNVDLATAHNLATNQGVTGFIAEAEYV